VAIAMKAKATMMAIKGSTNRRSASGILNRGIRMAGASGWDIIQAFYFLATSHIILE
jgi:hypothetical protein